MQHCKAKPEMKWLEEMRDINLAQSSKIAKKDYRRRSRTLGPIGCSPQSLGGRGDDVLQNPQNKSPWPSPYKNVHLSAAPFSSLVDIVDSTTTITNKAKLINVLKQPLTTLN